jgi:hypothetical protein
MVDEHTSSDARMSARRTAWIRALIVHPAVFVLPWLVPCIIVSRLSGSDLGDVSWGFYLVPVGAVGSFVASMTLADRRGPEAVDLFEILFLGFAGAAIALAVGVTGVMNALEVACHGQYECPF